jgi:hypothetical protein
MVINRPQRAGCWQDANVRPPRDGAGVTEFLMVLDTQRTLLAIQDQLAKGETRTATALIAVYKALGGGWETEQSSDPDAMTSRPSYTGSGRRR